MLFIFYFYSHVICMFCKNFCLIIGVYCMRTYFFVLGYSSVWCFIYTYVSIIVLL